MIKDEADSVLASNKEQEVSVVAVVQPHVSENEPLVS